MNLHNDPDAVMAAWLADGPFALPQETRSAISVGMRTVTRRRPGNSIRRVRLPALDLRRLSIVVGATAAVVVLAGLVLNLWANAPRVGNPSPSPSASPTASPMPAGGMWPQTSLEEVRQAQQRADAGDP